MKNEKEDLSSLLLCIPFVIIAVCMIFYFVQPFIGANPEQVEKTQEVVLPEKQTVATVSKMEKTQTVQPPLNKYNYSFKYDIKVSGTLKKLTFTMYVPQSEQLRQYTSISNLSKQPDRYYKTDKGTIAEYNFHNISDTTITVSFDGKLKTNPYDLKNAKKVNYNMFPENDLSKYLLAEKLIESNDEYIKRIANSINGSSQEEIVGKIFRYVQGNIKYTITPNIGARQALMIKKGKCTEYAAAMVALCRAKGIPARTVTGNFMRNKDSAHAWVEVYYKEYGWVTYDPTVFNSRIVYKDKKTGKVLKVVNKLNPAVAQSDYIILSRNELAQRLVGFEYSADKQGTAQIVTSFAVEKM